MVGRGMRTDKLERCCCPHSVFCARRLVLSGTPGGATALVSCDGGGVGVGDGVRLANVPLQLTGARDRAFGRDFNAEPRDLRYESEIIPTEMELDTPRIGPFALDVLFFSTSKRFMS